MTFTVRLGAADAGRVRFATSPVWETVNAAGVLQVLPEKNRVLVEGINLVIFCWAPGALAAIGTPQQVSI